MRYDSSFNYAMAGLYRTAVAVSALVIFASAAHAADPPVPRSNVSVNVNPTTGYYSVTNSTLRLPNGVSAAPTSGVPVVSKYSGGLKQTIPTGITIDAIKKSAPLPAVVRSTTQSVKGAATRCLKSAKCNVGLILAGEGLNRLFDGLDWVMGEGAQVQKKTYVDDGLGSISGLSRRDGNGVGFVYSTTCPAFLPYDSQVSCQVVYDSGNWGTQTETYNLWGSSSSATLSIRRHNGTYHAYNYRQTQTASSVLEPVSPSEVSSGVDSNYSPEPSDWPALTPYLELDDVEITSAPTLQGEPRTTTVFDAEGNPYKVTQTNIWYDFDIRDNPSPRPALDMKTREETETYENGELTGKTTTESTASGGSGSSSESQPESPIDCDLFPTACAWFDWTQEEPTEPDDDLSGLLQEVPIVSETYTITGGVAACPAPMVLDLSVFGSREVSYQPLCDLASTMKYLYLALMSFAAAVLLNRSVNRV
ncbi:MAG TPA: virulence factor TspB C-terminal domain-related protein [Pseudomonadales bacterium]|nr:virulence factor TspB C-terminal domain-related protein [Pseudomonadales bacterium]